MTPKMRPMNSEDKPCLMRILRATPEFKPDEVNIAEEVLDTYLRNGTQSGYYVVVAELGNEVIGYVCYGPAPMTRGTWDVYWMAVAREKQGLRIGTALLASAEDEIKLKQGRLAVIETSSKPDYQRARRFYERRGYELLARIPDFYEMGDDKMLFVKRLIAVEAGHPSVASRHYSPLVFTTKPLH